ncbi:hypothetical protein CPC08DRAFT_769851 [Agrocybe pediades]|nr:hypothetical protein CPC08DRAFT_769851 [Agrocybe pediades]
MIPPDLDEIQPTCGSTLNHYHLPHPSTASAATTTTVHLDTARGMRTRRQTPTIVIRQRQTMTARTRSTKGTNKDNGQGGRELGGEVGGKRSGRLCRKGLAHREEGWTTGKAEEDEDVEASRSGWDGEGQVGPGRGGVWGMVRVGAQFAQKSAEERQPGLRVRSWQPPPSTPPPRPLPTTRTVSARGGNNV